MMKTLLTRELRACRVHLFWTLLGMFLIQVFLHLPLDLWKSRYWRQDVGPYLPIAAFGLWLVVLAEHLGGREIAGKGRRLLARLPVPAEAIFLSKLAAGSLLAAAAALPTFTFDALFRISGLPATSGPAPEFGGDDPLVWFLPFAFSTVFLFSLVARRSGAALAASVIFGFLVLFGPSAAHAAWLQDIDVSKDAVSGILVETLAFLTPALLIAAWAVQRLGDLHRRRLLRPLGIGAAVLAIGLVPGVLRAGVALSDHLDLSLDRPDVYLEVVGVHPTRGGERIVLQARRRREGSVVQKLADYHLLDPVTGTSTRLGTDYRPIGTAPDGKGLLAVDTGDSSSIVRIECEAGVVDIAREPGFQGLLLAGDRLSSPSGETAILIRDTIGAALMVEGPDGSSRRLPFPGLRPYLGGGRAWRVHLARPEPGCTDRELRLQALDPFSGALEERALPGIASTTLPQAAEMGFVMDVLIVGPDRVVGWSGDRSQLLLVDLQKGTRSPLMTLPTGARPEQLGCSGAAGWVGVQWTENGRRKGCFLALDGSWRSDFQDLATVFWSGFGLVSPDGRFVFGYADSRVVVLPVREPESARDISAADRGENFPPSWIGDHEWLRIEGRRVEAIDAASGTRRLLHDYATSR